MSLSRSMSLHWRCKLYFAVSILFVLFCMAVSAADAAAADNIYAVIVSSSRYWFNYRHAMNALAIYEILKNNGVPDSQIVLMLADEYATNPRNAYKNGMYVNTVRGPSWYSNETEIDYRGADVNVQNFLDATLGIGPVSLDSDETSNLLIYLTGHGGDQFFKFQDEEELTAQDIANLAQELYDRKKFRQSLWVADTCQAFTLFDKIDTPNVLALGTSLRDQNAYAHHSDSELGLSVIERWTNGFVNQHAKAGPQTTLADAMVTPYERKHVLGAHVGIREDTSSRKFRNILLSEFFGSKTRQPSHGNSLDIAESDLSNLTPMAPPPRSAKLEESQSDPTADDGADGVQEKQEPAGPSFFSLISILGVLVAICRHMESRA